MRVVSKMRVKLKKSLIGQNKNRIATANSLGLRKMNSSTIQPDNGSTRGKISRIRDLVTVEEIADEDDLSRAIN